MMRAGVLTAHGTSAGFVQNIVAILANPALVLFLSANIVNAGNLLFNILFSRWLGPEMYSDLALLLTVKLSLLCVLSAVQFEVAARSAKSASQQLNNIAIAQTNKLLKVLIWVSIGLVALGSVAAYQFLPERGMFTEGQVELAFLVFAICLPFMAPLCLARGISQGALDLKHVVLSAQVEMGVRLFGSILAWFLGFGLSGIAFAIAASIILGWVFAAPKVSDSKPTATAPTALSSPKQPASIINRTLFFAAMPWACLQLGQVLALDGDFLVGKILFSAEESGYLAVAVLVQRILFFGSFGLAAAVLPTVAAAKNWDELKSAVLPVIALFAATAIPFTSLMAMFPELIVTLVFGETYINAAPALFWASISGSSFVAIYLIATFFMAIDKRQVGLWILGMSLVIAGVLGATAYILPEINVLSLIKIKAVLLMIAATLFSLVACREFKSIKSG